MDNQQTTSINDNYVAGLIDSDFGVFMTSNTYKGKLNIRPVINFVNTRFVLVDVLSEYLKNCDINHFVQVSEATVSRDTKRIIIGRLGKCIDFVDKFSSLSIVRRKQLLLLREFCDTRVDYVANYGWKFNNTPYTQRQKDIVEEVRLLNLNYNRDDGFRNKTPSWFAGIIDGDGSIYFSDTHRTCRYKNTEYRYRKIIPWLKITTESHTALNNIIEFYEEKGIRYYIDKVRGKLSKDISKDSYKYHYSIVVKEFDPLLYMLDYVGDMLVAKKEQCNLVREYIYKKKVDKHYTDACFGLVEKVKYLNNNY